MGKGFGDSAVAIFGTLMTVAVVAVIVSQRAQTSNIIQAIGSATGGSINAAISPLMASDQSQGR